MRAERSGRVPGRWPLLFWVSAAVIAALVVMSLNARPASASRLIHVKADQIGTTTPNCS
ncbi:MAG: hypothetical protein IRY97_00805, partial [Thermomicrobiaceae bacterium]|nr:hypothetical protein [Thermomicrobiaceae bacterium]